MAWQPSRFSMRGPISANYLRNDFKFDNDPVYDDNELAGLPPKQLRAELRWQLSERFYATPNLEWAPDDYYVDHANTFRAPGYTTIGLKIGGRIGDRWSWFAAARKPQDRKWIATTDVVADARELDPANFLRVMAAQSTSASSGDCDRRRCETRAQAHAEAAISVGRVY